ncbi:hypothetical protein [Paracoccus sp. (in: a-proteobacteria)]|uniref:hypothetical protein n=1 Tax=Paracoccus sp. TaxID=267 RepID=UPI00396CAAD2
MTPLHPFAAAVAGLALSVAALTAEPDQQPEAHVSWSCHSIPDCQPLPTIGFDVGDVAKAADLHLITRPGRYGLSKAPEGDRYAILDGRIVRIEADTAQVLSILWAAPRVLD